MIISASRRTDLPAFYSEWFMRRINDGFFYSVNPFNPKKVKVFSLSPKDVDVIVFWSKYPKPLMEYLDKLDVKEFNYYFQYTLNDYPNIFEPHVPSIDERVETFKELSNKIGLKKVIWRYDPIIISSITPIDYHLCKLYDICKRLNGYTERLVISFLDFYGKVKNRLKKIGESNNIIFTDVLEIDYRTNLLNLAANIKKISNEFNLNIFTCAEEINLYKIGIEHGSCIDMNLIRDLFHIDKIYKKDKNQRKECFCSESVDMGVYDTCKFKCNYCYANSNIKKIENNLNKYNVNGPALIELLSDIELSSNKNNIPSRPKLF